jgi:methylated-DNA-[protein]-cysteine S-methyltransferase
MFYHFNSPLGAISYDWDGACCVRVRPGDYGATETSDDPVSQWLTDYFAGSVAPLPPLPPLAEPATAFQKKMRLRLLAIPAGEVRTYGELARQLVSSPRATGQALGANPLPILVPCHRIVAADGLGGFACGVQWKKRLLRFEGGI